MSIEDVNQISVKDLLEEGSILHQEGDLAQAEEIYRDLINRDPSLSEPYHLLGLVALKSGKQHMAKELIQTAITLLPQETVYHNSLGAVMYSLGEYKKAEQGFRQALSLDQYNVEANANLAKLFISQGRYTEALPVCEKGLLQDRRNKKLWELYALSCAQEQEFERGETTVKELFAEDKDIHQIESMAQALLACSLPQEALAWIRTKLEVSPEDWIDKLELAEVCLQCYEIDEAKNCAKSVLEVDPESVLARQILAKVYFLKGQDVKAIQLVDQALSLWPEDIDLSLLRAEILAEKGNTSEALDHIRPVVEKYGSTKYQVIDLYVPLMRLHQKQDKAVQALTDCLANTSLGLKDRRNLMFHLAELHQDIDQNNQAIKACREGNALKSGKYDRNQETNLLRRIFSVFDTVDLQANKHSVSEHPSLAFIIGLPGSGVEVLQNILSGHKYIFGLKGMNILQLIINELPGFLGTFKVYPECLQNADPKKLSILAKSCLSSLQDEVSTENKLVLQGSSLDFRHLGLIELLFPGASIINLKRNPYDAALEAFFTANPKGWLTCEGNLSDLAHMIELYNKYLERWNSKCSLARLDLSYEDLVRDTEKQIEQVLNFLRMDYEEECLELARKFFDFSKTNLLQLIQGMNFVEPGQWQQFSRYIKPILEKYE